MTTLIILYNFLNYLMEPSKSSNQASQGTKRVLKTLGPVSSGILQKGYNFNELERKVHQETKSSRIQVAGTDRSIQAYFIGPRGQNMEFFGKLIQKALNSQLAAREEYEIQDPRHITRKIKSQPTFMRAQDRLEQVLSSLLTKLKDLSPPFYSSRYFGHMNWETTIPSIVANFATMLYNPNNCAFQGGPLTTLLQIQVLKQFAHLFGYPKMLSFSKQSSNSQQSSWGHLTCGGTVANCQGMWAARNCRFLALSVRKYVQSIENTNNVKDITVRLVDGSTKKLLELTAWQILNVSNEQCTNVYDLCFKTLYGQDLDKYPEYQKHISELSIGERGILDMYNWIGKINKLNPEPLWEQEIPKPIVLGSVTAHYSLKKSLSVLGLGKNAYQSVYCDLDSRICLVNLRERLQNCLTKKIPILSVIAIVGTTEQSTVDNILEIVKLREQYFARGLYFHFHIDGAYGGYFVTMVREKQANQINSFSDYVRQQLQAFHHSDSITFDPHKTGYVPYTCGGIIYRNHRLRDNLSFSAPYIYSGAEPNMAIYGIQGSKPGSSVSSVYLSLQVLPLVRGGHGSLLQRTLKNTKVFTASLYTIKQSEVEHEYENGVLKQRFQCYLLPRLYCQKTGRPELRQEEMAAIQKIANSSVTKLSGLLSLGDQSFNNYYYNLGPDLNIVCFGLNYIDKTTNAFNKSLKNYNLFNRTFVDLSKPVGTDVSVRTKDLYVSSTEINKKDYGEQIFNDFLARHSLENDGQDTIVLIRSTIMNAFFTETEQTENKPPNILFQEQVVQNACQTLLHLGLR